MSCETSTVCKSHWTPADNPIPDLVAFMGYATTSYRAILYGVTLDEWYAGIRALDDRGVDIGIVLDSTQMAGPKARVKLASLLADRPHLTDKIVVGRSEKNAIIHLKGQCINYVDGQEPPEAYYGHWTEAAAAGYPVTWTGSYNLSSGAVNQDNIVDIMPGIIRARAFHNAFNSVWSAIERRGVSKPHVGK